MILVIRASDGASFSLDASHFNAITTLAEFRYNLLSPLLAIAPECLICMNEEGAQLREEALPQLIEAAAQPEVTEEETRSRSSLARNKSTTGAIVPEDVSALSEYKRIYVFDREHLDADPEVVANALIITEDQVLSEPELGPLDPLPSHISLSFHNLTTLRALLSSLALQRDSLSLGLSNLHRVMTGTSTSFAVFLEASNPLLSTWTELLEGLEGNMDAIAKVNVVGGLVSRTHGREGSSISVAAVGSASKEKERFLGDYVSREKMLAVRDGCAKVLAELQDRIAAVRTLLDEVLAGTAELQTDFEGTSLADLEACEHDAEEAHGKIEALVRIGEHIQDEQLQHENFDELSFIDAEGRDRIRFLVERKNAVTRYLIQSMQQISSLQSTIASMPNDLAALDYDLRTRTDNFKHLERLAGLIPAYIATVVEVVRRRDFARLLSSHSSTISQSLSNLTASERGRRVTYRSTFSGKLPWEVRGLGAGTEEIVLPFDVELKYGAEDLPELGREALDSLQKTFVDLEDMATQQSSLQGPIQHARKMIDEYMSEFDVLEQEFNLISLNPTTSVDVADLMRQIKSLTESNLALERQLQAERTSKEEELARLGQDLVARHAETTAIADKDRIIASLREQVVRMEDEKVKTDMERETELKESKAILDEVVRRAQQGEAEMKQQVVKTEEAHRQLSTSRSTALELNRKIEEAESKYSSLCSDNSKLQWDVSRAKNDLSQLEERLQSTENTRRELATSVLEKERYIRSQREEGDLDRAVLEKELDDIRSAMSLKAEEVESNRIKISSLEAIVDESRSQLAQQTVVGQGHAKELSEREGESEAARRGRDEMSQQLEKTVSLARSALVVARDLRDEYLSLAPLLTAPSSSKSGSATPPPSSLSLSTLPLDFATDSLDDLLASVQSFDREAFSESVKTKIESLTILTKKWQKECKSYRERARASTLGVSSPAGEKIAFRNFAVGDLALFLPTRNSTAQIWAAFNVSYPHHFLEPTGIISEQIKSREWIVARIKTVTERVVDAKDTTSNPFMLAPGTKFFLLEVESWSSKDRPSRRHASSSEKPRVSSRSTILEEGKAPLSRRRESSSTIPSSPLLENSSSSPTPSPSDGRLRNSVFPSNVTDLARSEFALINSDDLVPPPSTLVSSPSALTISLARSVPSEPYPLRSDSFASPFRSIGTATQTDYGEEPTTPALPASIFEPTITPAGAFPAFLPTKRSTRRYAATEISSSPNSMSLSLLVGGGGGGVGPRSVSSASSILSSSVHHRRGGSSTLPNDSATAPPKALATTSAQSASDVSTAADSSTWPTLNRSKEDDSKRMSMSIGRKSTGWSATPENRSSGPSSLLDAFRRGSTSGSPLPESSIASNEILKALHSSNNSAGKK